MNDNDSCIKKQILILSYYYVPYNITATFRIMRFVKYLPENGFKPIIVTADHKDVTINNLLLREIPKESKVIRFPEILKDSIYKSNFERIYNQKNNNLIKSIKHYFIRIIKDFILSPDKQILWTVFNSLRILKIVKKMKIPYVLVTGGPFSLFLLGVFLKKNSNTKLILDFRDPWKENTYQLSQTFIRRFHNKWMQNLALRNSDLVISVTKPIIDSLKIKKKIRAHVIPNGFDLTDFDDSHKKNKINDIFTFIYAGKLNLLDDNYNPKFFLEAYKIFSLKNKEKNFQLIIVSNLNKETVEFFDSLYIENIILYNYMPRNNLLELYKQANAFIQFTYPKKLDFAISIKLFEYTFFRKPILSFTSKSGYTAKFIKESRTGFVCENDNMEDIISLYNRAINLDITNFEKKINTVFLQNYNVRTQTKDLASLINMI